MLTRTFFASSLVVIMIPGPDLALVTRLMFRYERVRPAMAAAGGMITAGAVHVAVGMLGLAVLLASRPDIFAALRWAGAAVLLTWATLALRSALRPAAPGPPQPPDLADRGAFLQGLLCTGANPKVGIFLIAFLPQFVPPRDAAGARDRGAGRGLPGDRHGVVADAVCLRDASSV
jgi:threonine/homoserine/homoserine lactone efflux protein